MPIGPSHSGRSSSGSRSSGHSGSFRVSSFNHSSGPRHIHFGGKTIILSSRTASTLSIILFFIVFIGFACFGMIANINQSNKNISYYKSQICVIESDALYYNNLISNAKLNINNDNYHIVNAYFGNQSYYYYDDNPNKIGIYNSFTDDVTTWYFIVYEYTVSGQKYTGSTYTQYSFTQTQSLGQYIEIAYTIEDGEIYSINTSYSLDKNRDYHFAKTQLDESTSSKRSSIIILIVSAIILIALVYVLIVMIKKQIAKSKENAELEKSKKQAEVNEAKAKANQAERIASQFGRICEYCNSNVPDDATVCPSCGSRQFK